MSKRPHFDYHDKAAPTRLFLCIFLSVSVVVKIVADALSTARASEIILTIIRLFAYTLALSAGVPLSHDLLL
eukprot:g64762.t1